MSGRKNAASTVPVPALVLAAALAMVPSCEKKELPHNILLPPVDGKSDWDGSRWLNPEPLNPAAGDMVIYELQARSANACHPATGGETCTYAPEPDIDYYGGGCDTIDDLRAIKKSTLSDLLETTVAPGRTAGITLQYIDEVVGANTVWLMPVFPHNFQYSLPHPCDDLGSPYAVRDYYHVRGTLSSACISRGEDEWSENPCWGDQELRDVIATAHDRGMKVMLDLAFNHLGHEYLFYDYRDAVPVRRLVESGTNMWQLDETYDPALVHPEILDGPDELPQEAQQVIQELCGRPPQGQEDVRRYLMWREAFDWERDKMDCTRPATLENQVPGYYLGRDGASPSTGVGDNFTNDWVDVKFLFNNEADVYHQYEFARTRELAFRVINYYLSLGVDAFRLDHANGLTENEWRYIFRKAKFYQEKRGMPVPVFMSESFFNILEMSQAFDLLTEGYQHDICSGVRDATYIEDVLFENRATFIGDISFILLDLENHDEGRLLRPETGFDIWRGATFYAIAAASRGALMLMDGQEWGEPWGLAFKRSDYLRGRFPMESNWNDFGDDLTALYAGIHQARLSPANEALRKGLVYFPRTDRGQVTGQLLAMVKYMEDCSNTIFAFYRLWVDDIESTYAVTDDLAGRICLEDGARYRLVDVFTGENLWQEAYEGGTRTGSHIREFGIYTHLTAASPFQWLRLERQ